MQVKHLFVTLTVLFNLLLPSPSQAQEPPNVGEPRTVRMIYFLPNDRPFRADVVREIKDGIRRVQAFYAEQMQAHGYGKKTFRFETDAHDAPKVHRVDGQHTESYYVANGGDYWEEVERKFDMSKNIYLIIIGYDLDTTIAGKGDNRGKNSGWAWILKRFLNFRVVAHELGHAFGLEHDFRDDTYIMSYGSRRNQLSACAAHFLAAHPYFNPRIPLEEGPAPTIELISPRTYLSGSERVTIRLRVSDADGLHQVLLFGHKGLVACRALAGENDAIVEFNYDRAFSVLGFIGLDDAAVHPISVEAVDTNGNGSEMSFNLTEESAHQIATLEGHSRNQARVTSLIFSPDSRMLTTVTATDVKLWDVATQRNTATLEPHRGWSLGWSPSVAFSPNGKIIASGFDDGILKLWDVRTQADISTFEAHTARIISVAFSPNGKRIASGSLDGTVSLWDVATQNNISTFQQNIKWPHSVAFSPNGKIIASGSSDGTVSLWDVATQNNISTFQQNTEWPLHVSAVAFSPDGRMLASGGQKRIGTDNRLGIVSVWDVTRKRKVGFFEPLWQVLSVAFTPDGKIIASGSSDGTVSLWDVATGFRIQDLPHPFGVYSMAFSPDGRILAVGVDLGKVILWDTSVVVADFADFQRETQRPVTIPDTNLRTKIAETLNKPSSVRLILMDMLVLTELEAPNANIKDITGLEHARNLEELNLGSNNISDITPLAELKHLTSLYLWGNNISDISALAGLKQLTRLGVESNNISDASPLAKLTQLTSLEFGSNNIPDVSPLARLRQLTHLYLYSNNISDVSPLAKLTQLTLLALSSNNISDVSPLVKLNLTGTQENSPTLSVLGNPLSYASINTHIPAMQAKGIKVKFDNRAYPALVKVSGDAQAATVGETLPTPFVVEVQNERGKPMSDVFVTFAIATGGGRLSETTVTTDANGRAQTMLTLGQTPSKHTVRVSATGIQNSVTFTATATEPPMYWIEKNNGTLHRSKGNMVENFIPSVQNATSLAIDVARNKLYWTEQISNTTGKIQRANLDGSNVQLVKSLTSVPRGLALDTVNRKLYLTNSWGKVQRLNFNGSNFQPNLITGLDAPKSIVLDVMRGKLYWAEQTSNTTGKIQRANLDGSNVQLIKELTSVPLGLAIDAANSKLYLTNGWGKVQRLSSDGSNFEPNFITDLDSPEGIAVDIARGKLYWTETNGIKCGDLSGEDVQEVVAGLGTPTSIALSIATVESVIAAAPAQFAILPATTGLLPNYPNPFNPETWIPYQLAEPSKVTLTIYAVDGRVVQRLALGHQPVGLYHGKSRAAYWDGRNAQGERVASGVYFYTLTAGDFTATRKMLIMK